MQCKACGHWIPQQDQYCGKCGTKKPSQSANGGAWFNQAENLGESRKKVAPVAEQPKKPAVFPTAPQANKPWAYGYQKPLPVANSGWHWGWTTFVTIILVLLILWFLTFASTKMPNIDYAYEIEKYLPSELMYIQVGDEIIWLEVDSVTEQSRDEEFMSCEVYYEIDMSGGDYSVTRYLILSFDKTLLMQWELTDYEEYAPMEIEKEE